MRHAIISALGLFIGIGALGCSSQEPDEPAPAFKGGGQGEYADTSDAAYAPGPYGWKIGGVIANLEFIGYQNFMDPANGGAVQYLQLADFYNPVPANATFAVDPVKNVLTLDQGAQASLPLHGLQDGMALKLTNPAMTGNPDANAIYFVKDMDGAGCKLLDFTGNEVTLAAGSTGVQLVFPPGSGYGAGVAKPRALQLITSATWCGPCNAEAANVLPGEYAELKPQGAHFLTVLIDGPQPGTAAKIVDIFNWASAYDVNYSIVVDPEAKVMPLYEAAFPGNMLIRTSDMRLIIRVAGSPDPNNPSDPFYTAFHQVLAGTYQDPPEWHQ
jgi:hypothetical protein